MNKIKNVFFVLLIFICNHVFGQAVGDFGSIASGNYKQDQHGEFGMEHHGHQHRWVQFPV
ncbi:MAG: hypothetical protein IPL24_16755 [Bacteroidetes bacterium]|nr:hypothetical protein [Bacteroidota bacterium]